MARFLELRIKVMRKWPQRVGGTQNAKVGLIAHPIQNSIRNMIGTLLLMSGGLMRSKSRFLDGPPSWNFNLEGIPGWREIQITDMASSRTTATRLLLCWCNFCKSHLLTLFRAPLWQLCHHFQPEHVEIWYFWNFWEVISEIWISRQT